MGGAGAGAGAWEVVLVLVPRLLEESDSLRSMRLARAPKQDGFR